MEDEPRVGRALADAAVGDHRLTAEHALATVELLEHGAALVRARCEDSRIPYVLLRADPADAEAWTRAAVAAVDSALDGAQVDPR